MRAWLTGVGAMTLANAVVFSLAFEIWSDGILQFRARPEFEIVGLPAYAFGAAVAVGTGGWRGLIALVVLASLWMVDVPFIPGADRTSSFASYGLTPALSSACSSQSFVPYV